MNPPDSTSSAPPADHSPDVTRAARETLLGQRGLVVWLYGLSGAGKTTLATALTRLLHAEGRYTVLLDGDILRTGLNQGLGFSATDRTENIRRAAEVARLFARTGAIVICAFITPAQAMRTLARQIVGDPDFLEVHLACSFAECERRDVKGLYAKARAGGVPLFTGRDSAFESPEQPDVVLDTENQPIAFLVDRLAAIVRDRCRLTAGPNA